MDYETRSALQNKADSWKVTELENQLRYTKDTVRDLEVKLNRMESRVSQLSYAIESLIGVLVDYDDGQVANRVDAILGVKNSL